MGNCLNPQRKVVRIVKKDGKVLEYMTPLRVHRVLSDFDGQHAISEGFLATEYLKLDARLVGGRSYYLVPLVRPVKEDKKPKKVRFADQLETGGRAKDAVVQVKLVISRKELQEMLQGGGTLALNPEAGMAAHCKLNSSEEHSFILDHILEGN